MMLRLNGLIYFKRAFIIVFIVGNILAVKLALEKDANHKQIADNLEINYKTLCSWIDRPPEKMHYKTCYQQLITENAQLKRK